MKRGRPPFPDLLTPRESEVHALLQEGLTNQQIAARLGISESGARYHVSEILSKLGVSSREEAARWRPGRPVFSVAPLLALRRFCGATARTASLASIVLATALLVALALGIAVMSSRSGGGRPTAGRPVEEQSIQRVRDLAEEARQEARAVLSVAELTFIAYATPSGLYTFRFFEPGSSTEVSLLGPYDADLAAARWEIIREERPAGAPTPSRLDLSNLRNDFLSVAEAAAAQSRSAAENMGLIVINDGGALAWGTTARLGPAIVVRCEAPDSDLSMMTCDEP